MYRRPEDIHHALAQGCGSADLNALMALFEDGATLVPASGPLVRGRDAIRASLADFLANPSHFTLRLEQVVETDDIALLVSSWTLTGTTPDGDAIELCGRTSDVVRRQRDGTWRLVIDHPYGGVPAHTTESAAMKGDDDPVSQKGEPVMKRRKSILMFGGLGILLLALPLTAVRLFGTSSARQVDRGRYLVSSLGCADCHSPKKMGPQGPEPDEARFLAGHPENAGLPPAPASSQGPWMITASWDLTAWSGPWGVSYPFNLTPDENTGLGSWSEDTFIKAIRTGRHMGVSRPILPPMPWQSFSNLSDDDLKAIFVYLRSLPAVKNRVPDPVIAPIEQTADAHKP